MSKLIKRLLGAIAIFIFGYLIFLPLWFHIMPNSFSSNIPYYQVDTYGQTYTRLQEADTIEKVDILILGSSHAYRGFDTRIFRKAGYSVFNLGSSAQTPIQSEYLFNIYKSKIKVKILIIEASPSSLSSDGVESAIDIIPKSGFDKGKLKMAYLVNNIKAWNCLWINFVNTRFDINKPKKNEKQILGDDYYIAGGFVEKKNYPRPNSLEEYPAIKFEFKEKQIESLGRLIKEAKELGCRVLLVQTQVRKGYYQSFETSLNFDSLANGFGCKYLNFNKLNPLPDSCFYDNHHMNQVGVFAFNDFFLNENYLN